MQAKYVSHYLTDSDVARFARQSFDRADQIFTQEQDDRLIKFLARGCASGDWESFLREIMNPKEEAWVDAILDVDSLLKEIRKMPVHWAPFGHPHITLRMTAPVPIRVQCFKHKIGFVESEESRRYISSKPDIYIPSTIRAAATNKKQGSAGIHESNENLLNRYIDLCRRAVDEYLNFVSEGVCPEQARFLLPQACEVNWVWTGSLYAYANFYNQRSDAHAQCEIQELAESVAHIVEPLFPVSWAALTRGAY